MTGNAEALLAAFPEAEGTLPADRVEPFAAKAKELGFFLLDITVVDYLTHPHPPVQARFAGVYLFRHRNFAETVTMRTVPEGPRLELPTISHLFQAADWPEREAWDQYGVVFKGHPNLRRLLNHHQFKGHPLRKDYPITKGQFCTETDDLMGEMTTRLFQKGLIEEGMSCTDHGCDDRFMFLNLGPSHPASHGTLRTLLALDGETIMAAVSEIGYLHRGFEKNCETHTYNQIIPYTDRLNYVSAIANNVAFSKAVEEKLGITVPDRGIFIRVLLTELSRIIDHLVCVGANLVDMGALTNYFYLLNPREDVNRLLSKLTGARLTNSYTRIGGQRGDLYDGFAEELEFCLQRIEKGLGDTLGLIEHNRIFHDRTQNVCVVGPEEALLKGLSGPNLRASGVEYDLRKNAPYYYYDTFDFDLVVGSVGDVYDRIMVRCEEIRQSLSIVRQAMKRMPGGPVNCDDRGVFMPPKPLVYDTIEGVMDQFKLVYEGVKVPAGESYHAFEAANGELGFFIVSDGSGTPYKVKVKAPSLTAMAAFPDMIEGHMIADAVINLGSINIIAGELDR